VELWFLPAIYLGPNYGGGNEDNGDFLQKNPMHVVGGTTLNTHNPASGHHQPTPLLVTPGHSQASLGQSFMGSLFLSPVSWCTQVSLRAFQVSISQSCVSSGSSMVGLMATCSKRAYAIPRSAALHPVTLAVHCWPIPPQEMLKHSSVSVSVGSLGPGAQSLLEPSEYLCGNGVWF